MRGKIPRHWFTWQRTVRLLTNRTVFQFVDNRLLTAGRIEVSGYSMNPPSKQLPWTDVAVFENLNTGRTVETSLINQGLPARVYDDKLVRRLLFLRPPRATFRLQVHADDFYRAHEILKAGPTDSLREAIHCPDCGSAQISYPQMTRKFIMPTITLHLGILLRLLDHQCYCEKCHCLWSLPGEAARLTPKVSEDPWPNSF